MLSPTAIKCPKVGRYPRVASLSLGRREWKQDGNDCDRNDIDRKALFSLAQRGYPGIPDYRKGRGREDKKNDDGSYER